MEQNILKAPDYRTIQVAGSPDFIGMINWPEQAVRAYVHSAGSNYWLAHDNTKEIVARAQAHLANTLGEPRARAIMAFEGAQVGAEDKQILIGLIWNQQRMPIIDFFRFDFDKTWPGNPEIFAYTFKHGVYDPNLAIGCGDGLIILAAEEQYRRATANLEEFLLHPPIILGSRIEVSY